MAHYKMQEQKLLLFSGPVPCSVSYICWDMFIWFILALLRGCGFHAPDQIHLSYARRNGRRDGEKHALVLPVFERHLFFVFTKKSSPFTFIFYYYLFFSEL